MAASRDAYRSPRHRLLVELIRTAERIRTKADAFFRPWRLSVSQFNVLAILVRERGALAQNVMADRLIVSRANVSELLGRVQARGWVARARDARDDRVKRVRVTPRGRALVRRVEKAYFREINRLCARLRDREMKDAVRLFERLSDGALRSG